MSLKPDIWEQDPPDRTPKTIFQIDGILIAYIDHDATEPDRSELNRIMDELEKRYNYGTGNRREWRLSQNGQIIVMTISKPHQAEQAGNPDPANHSYTGC